MGFSVRLWGAGKLVPVEYWCPYGIWRSTIGQESRVRLLIYSQVLFCFVCWLLFFTLKWFTAEEGKLLPTNPQLFTPKWKRVIWNFMERKTTFPVHKKNWLVALGMHHRIRESGTYAELGNIWCLVHGPCSCDFCLPLAPAGFHCSSPSPLSIWARGEFLAFILSSIFHFKYVHTMGSTLDAGHGWHVDRLAYTRWSKHSFKSQRRNLLEPKARCQGGGGGVLRNRSDPGWNDVSLLQRISITLTESKSMETLLRKFRYSMWSGVYWLLLEDDIAIRGKLTTPITPAK